MEHKNKTRKNRDKHKNKKKCSCYDHEKSWRGLDFYKRDQGVNLDIKLVAEGAARNVGCCDSAALAIHMSMRSTLRFVIV